MGILYSKEEVIKLLKEQRELCYNCAKISTSEYVNPYSESDGNIIHSIDKESIIDAELKL